MDVTITRPATRRTTLAATLASTLLLIPAAGLAQAPDRVDLPNGWQPEGITTDGTNLYVGSLADGAIWRGDPMTGQGSVLAAGVEGLSAAGVDWEEGADRLWAAGAGSAQVRAFDAASGELLQTYPFEAGFLNDVAATPEAVFVTDSFMPQLLVIPIGEDGSIAAPEETQSLPLSGDLVYGEGFNVNGIVAHPAGLIVVHTAEGQLYRVDPATGEASLIDSGGAELTAGDGMELAGDTLYVVRNQLNQVAVLELDPGATTATLVGELSADGLDVPTTAALIGDDLWAVNARFGTDATAETEYWITRLDAAAAEEVSTEE